MLGVDDEPPGTRTAGTFSTGLIVSLVAVLIPQGIFLPTYFCLSDSFHWMTKLLELEEQADSFLTSL